MFALTMPHKAISESKAIEHIISKNIHYVQFMTHLINNVIILAS